MQRPFFILNIIMLMPVALGAKSKSLVHILSGFHHTLLHECHGLNELQKVCNCTFGCCTDLGAEIGTAESVETSKSSWLHPTIVAAVAPLQHEADEDWAHQHGAPTQVRTCRVCVLLQVSKVTWTYHHIIGHRAGAHMKLVVPRRLASIILSAAGPRCT